MRYQRTWLWLALALFCLTGCKSKEQASFQVKALLGRTTQFLGALPAFSYVQLKVFKQSQQGLPLSLVTQSNCLNLSDLQSTASGRRRMTLNVNKGGPYYIQLAGYSSYDCTLINAVVAGAARNVILATDQDNTIPIFLGAVGRFSVVDTNLAPVPQGAEIGDALPRILHTATLLGDGTILVAGGMMELKQVSPSSQARCLRGFDRCYSLFSATNSIQRFDPGSGYSYLMNNLNERRALHSATLTADGKVALSGGAQTATLAVDGFDTSLIKAEASCASAVSSNSEGCLSKTMEVVNPMASGVAPILVSMTISRAAHASIRVRGGGMITLGGRTARFQEGCFDNIQCRPPLICGTDGRCNLVEGPSTKSHCADLIGRGWNQADVCLDGYTCIISVSDANYGKCIKQGCQSAADCVGCFQADGCSGAESTCEQGKCVKRGCSAHSDCLGSNRRCINGACHQLGCDSLSGCPTGKVCHLASGKCQDRNAAVDCNQPANCNCLGNADCPQGFTCQDQGEFAGRCKRGSTGCPSTLCRRDCAPGDQFCFYDSATHALKSEVNCVNNQCVLEGCLADIDCPANFFCQKNSGKCINGRFLTDITDSMEFCALSDPLPDRPCTTLGAKMSTSREGHSLVCLARVDGECSRFLIWGGNTDAERLAEVRNSDGSMHAAFVSPSGTSFHQSLVAPSEGGAIVLAGANYLTQVGQTATFNFSRSVYHISGDGNYSVEESGDVLPEAISLAAAVPLGNQLVLLGGGTKSLLSRAQGGSLDVNRVFSPDVQYKLVFPRIGHRAVVLPDQRIVVLGGMDTKSAATPVVLSSIEIFTPRSFIK